MAAAALARKPSSKSVAKVKKPATGETLVYLTKTLEVCTIPHILQGMSIADAFRFVRFSRCRRLSIFNCLPSIFRTGLGKRRRGSGPMYHHRTRMFQCKMRELSRQRQKAPPQHQSPSQSNPRHWQYSEYSLFVAVKHSQSSRAAEHGYIRPTPALESMPTSKKPDDEEEVPKRPKTEKIAVAPSKKRKSDSPDTTERQQKVAKNETVAVVAPALSVETHPSPSKSRGHKAEASDTFPQPLDLLFADDLVAAAELPEFFGREQLEDFSRRCLFGLYFGTTGCNADLITQGKTNWAIGQARRRQDALCSECRSALWPSRIRRLPAYLLLHLLV